VLSWQKKLKPNRDSHVSDNIHSGQTVLAKTTIMNRLNQLLIIICLFVSSTALAQRSLKLSVYAGSGISFFSGPGSTDHSKFYRNGLAFPNDVDTMGNHFGSMAAPCFIAGVQVDRALSKTWTLSVSTQYEHNGSRLNGDSVMTPGGNFKVNGTYTAYNDFISINPQLSRTFSFGKLGLMLHGGFDYSFKLSFIDQFDYTDPSGQKFSIARSGGHPEVDDFRLTAGGMISLNKWSLDLNYKHGLNNYNEGGNGNVFSRMLHIKLLYRLLKLK